MQRRKKGRTGSAGIYAGACNPIYWSHQRVRGGANLYEVIDTAIHRVPAIGSVARDIYDNHIEKRGSNETCFRDECINKQKKKRSKKITTNVGKSGTGYPAEARDPTRGPSNQDCNMTKINKM